MNRLKLIKNQMKNTYNPAELKTQASNLNKLPTKYIKSAYVYLNFDDYLKPDEIKYRQNLRNYLDKEVKKQLIEFVDRTEFPFEIIRKFVIKFPKIVAPRIEG